MRMTGDFSYLKKYYYEGKITQEDLDYICGYKIENCYEELLKEKIKDTKSRPIYPKIIDNMDDIDKAIKYTDVLSDEIIEESKRNNRIVSVPRIGKRKFEELVIGALAYIDPTNNMVEEYLKLKKAGKIDLIHGKRNISSEYTEERNSFGNIINCSIKVYMKGDLTDVGALVHEFGHYYYRKYDEDVRKNNDLFGEFPSIYLEFKTFEYLGKIYTNRQVKSTCAFRMKSNNSIIGQLLPSLYCIKQHMNTDEYHLDEVKEYAEKFVPKDYAKAIEKASPRKRKKLVDRTVFINKARTLNKLDDDVESIKYIIGTYFAMNSIRNLKHEDVLRKLEYMQYHKVDFTQMKMLLKIAHR